MFGLDGDGSEKLLLIFTSVIRRLQFFSICGSNSFQSLPRRLTRPNRVTVTSLTHQSFNFGLTQWAVDWQGGDLP